MKTTTTYWLEMCPEDMSTAESMLRDEHWLFVGFTCHLTIERALKAYWCEALEEPALKIHTLTRLAERSGLLGEMSDEQHDLLIQLEPLNIECRYPSDKARISGMLTPEYCTYLVNETKKLMTWILNRLSSLPGNTKQQC